MQTHPPGEFSVCQFFDDKEETYEYVRRHVSAEEAVLAFKHYTNSVGANFGTTKRVIITDGGDCINMEWIFGKGITYPEDLAAKINAKENPPCT
jgi:hypothetical protein